MQKNKYKTCKFKNKITLKKFGIFLKLTYKNKNNLKLFKLL